MNHRHSFYNDMATGMNAVPEDPHLAEAHYNQVSM